MGVRRDRLGVMRRLTICLAALTVLAATAATGVAGSAGAAGSTAAAAGPLLGSGGIGPLRLGMTRSAALATGWLAHRATGCPLGGPPLPITYRLTGSRAPRGIAGTAEFDRGRLRVLSFTRGAHTAAGVTVGRTTTAEMVSRYRRAGYAATARFDPTFGGTFVRVRRHGRQVIGGFAVKGPLLQLAIPDVPVCE
ncbi:MAG: hypothetical protein QOF77_477 [Solirubrobacteraceae bacterium]|nr:hypothetical protein [Solirubrobacteraceae bacterium]